MFGANMKVYLDDSIEPLGHSCVIEYEDEDGHISRGGTCSGASPRLPVLMIVFKAFDLEIIAGAQEYAIWSDMMDRRKMGLFATAIYNEEASRFMWSILFKSMTRDRMTTILNQVYARAFAAGRNNMRLEFVKVLQGD
jgi:hypothetical protein